MESELQAVVPEAIDVVTKWVSQQVTPLPLEVIGALLALTEAARKYANPEDELWWCKAHARAIDTFVGLTPKTCLYDGRPGHCDPVAALIVLALGVTEAPDGQ